MKLDFGLEPACNAVVTVFVIVNVVIFRFNMTVIIYNVLPLMTI